MTTTVFSAVAAPVVPSHGRLRPLGLGEVQLRDGFWGRRQRINADATLPHIARRLESEGWLPNFDLAAQGRLPEGRRGREFADSEVYKYLEAVAWEIGRTDDPALERLFHAVVARVAAAQEPDGYLNTAFGRTGQPPRWSHLEWGHELYCLGHLFQAAVARARTRPDADDGLLQVATRAADLVCAVFGEHGDQGVCGHPEVEVGLAELGRATGRHDYVEQAARFVERRGHGALGEIAFGPAYFQDDMPVRDATVLRGHAVRANYLAAGAADVADELNDSELRDALRTQWENTVARRTYITGGQGSRHSDEAFGDDWELPPDRAYSETCAGVGSIMFAWRMLLADGDERYADLIERTLYNVVATSPSAEGTAFYYANTLHQRVPGTPADPDATSARASSTLRAPWFEVSCCPPNVARTLASLAAYFVTADDDGVQVHQYAAASVRTRLANRETAAFEIDADYPVSGTVRIRVTEPGAWTLGLRVPAWAAGATVRVAPTEGAEEIRDAAPGTVSVTRTFAPGDEVVLELPLRPRVVRPDGRIDAVRGCIAVERGPEVLALESVDLAPLGVDDVADMAAVPGAEPAERDGAVWLRMARMRQSDGLWPYGDEQDAAAPAGEVRLVPYHEWANRGPSTMRVWIPVTS